MLRIHKLKCEIKETTTVRNSKESYLHWRNHFHKSLSCFRIIPEFEAHNEIDSSGVGNKTTFFQTKILFVMVII